MIDRRSLLLAAAHAGLLFPGIAFARAETERRLVVFLLRGALDGLHAVVPYGEPAYTAARRQLALSPGSDGGAVKLDGMRSEEHTSETPVTNAHLVCRLLLEKKKQQQQT